MLAYFTFIISFLNFFNPCYSVKNFDPVCICNLSIIDINKNEPSMDQNSVLSIININKNESSINQNNITQTTIECNVKQVIGRGYIYWSFIISFVFIFIYAIHKVFNRFLLFKKWSAWSIMDILAILLSLTACIWLIILYNMNVMNFIHFMFIK